MNKEESRERFSEAKKRYVDGAYEEALSLLTALEQENPGVFNIQFPILQCLQHLDRLDEVKALHARLKEKATKDKHHAKLRQIEKWIAKKEKGGSTQDTDGDAAARTPEGEPGETAPPKQKQSKGLPKVLRGLLLGVEIAAILVAGFAGIYLFRVYVIRQVPEFVADIKMELHDSSYTGRLYFKNPETSRTEIMDNVFIVRENNVERLSPDENIYSTADPAELVRRNPLIGLGDFQRWRERNGAEHIGRERVQGFPCDIYKTTREEDDDLPAVSTTVWYSHRLNFPLRVETTSGENIARVSVTLNNIQTGNLPDELFEVPEGFSQVDPREHRRRSTVPIEDLPENLPEIPGFM